MGQVIQFEETAVASLRQRLGAAESANEDLVAFARGHSGAVAAIHRAVLGAIEADSVEELLTSVTVDWPKLLGLDVVTIGLVIGGQGFRADDAGIGFLDSSLIDRALKGLDEVELRTVDRGHPLFGRAASGIRAEALIRVGQKGDGSYGLLALGHRQTGVVETGHGAALLRFLGRSLDAMLTRWSRPHLD